MRAFGLIFLLLAGLARADAPALNGTFGLWLGGLKLGEATMRSSADADGWRIDGAARAAGVVGWVVDVDSRGFAHGSGGARAPVSNFYRIEGDFGDGRQWIEMRRDGRGLITQADPPQRERWYDVRPGDLLGALDPLTAGLAALGDAPAGRICNRVVAVFDSRRRFDLVLGPPREKADGLVCDGRYRRVAGYKEKHLRRPDGRFTLHWSVVDGAARFERLIAPTDFGAAVLRRID